MSSWRAVVLAASILATIAVPGKAAGQTAETRTEVILCPATKQPACALTATNGLVKFEELEKEFLAGKVTEARQTAKALLGAFTWGAGGPSPDGDTVFVVWVGKSLAGTPELHRLKLKQTSDRPFTLDMIAPGSGPLPGYAFELFLAPDEQSTLDSAYLSTRVANPLLALLPDLAKQILNAMFPIVGALKGAIPAPMWVTASRVRLPFDRASIAITSRAVLGLQDEDIRTRAEDLAAQVSFENPTGSKWMLAYAKLLPAVIVKTLPDCTYPGEWTACLAKVDKAFTAAFKECKITCVPGGTPTADDGKQMETVDAKFRSFVEGLRAPTVVTATATIGVSPLTHLSFGSAIAVLVTDWEPTRRRVTLDKAGLLQADPLPRSLVLAVVNWSPGGYDSASYRPTSGQHSQFFFGAILSPDVGMAAGYSQHLVSGLALNAGYGVIFSKGLNETDQIGVGPGVTTHAFALSVSHGLFFGGSFNFKAG